MQAAIIKIIDQAYAGLKGSLLSALLFLSCLFALSVIFAYVVVLTITK